MRLKLLGTFLREFTIRAALVALIVRALVPAGWMPNPHGLADGAAIVLCTLQGPVAAVIGPDGKPAKPNSAHSDGCVLAAMAGHGLPIAAAALLHPYPEQIARFDSSFREQAASQPHYRPQNPRGPPLSA